MRAAFALDLNAVKEQVHQHRFAAAYSPPKIESAHRVRLFAKEPPDRAATRRDGFQLCLRLGKCADGGRLVRVGLQLSGFDQRFILEDDTSHFDL
jgi:hypothetical protein